MSRHRQGIWFGVAAYTTWGVAPAFWKLLGDVPALQQMAHRVVWAVPLLAAAVLLLGRRAVLARAAGTPGTVVVTAMSAALLAANWGVFVWAIADERIVEVSLGYFINPLLSVALGVVLLRERLRPAQVVAVALATAGVAYMTIRLGELPWVSLVLAGTFALYGLLKKRPEAAPPLEGLLGETIVAGIPALVFILIAGSGGDGAFGAEWGDTLLLVATGAVTATPLLLFGAAAQRVPLSTVGLLQYLAPSLQFLLGVAAYGESVTSDQLVGFGFVWVALAVFTADNMRAARRDATLPV
jgi:chloramphenicol-sensitive protein RarD